MTEKDLLSLEALLSNSPHQVSLLSNAAAFLYEKLGDVCWVGFYLVDDKGDLYLGPFQGRPACVSISRGKGVCGTSLAEGRTLIVPDVSKFPGYISCDAEACSEIVIPIRHAGQVVAVLDLDSPRFARFTAEDQTGLEGFVRILEEEWGQMS